MRKTKIVCTLGPASSEEAMIEKLALAGMNVARLNFSHGSHESHIDILNKIKAVRERLDLPLATLMDTRGPEIRTGILGDGETVLRPGSRFTIVAQECFGDEGQCSTTYPNLYKEVKEGGRILIDDGQLELIIEEVRGSDIIGRVIVGGSLGSSKGMNIPDTPLNLPFLSDRDRKDIRLAVDQGFDFIAASFVRTADDVYQLRELIKEYGGDQEIIAKIENRQGLDNIDEIISASDGVMIARGDLGVEVPAHEVPIAQKQIIKKCVAAGKNVIIATQMLDSMIRNPRPTRAEVSDVANGIFDGAGAIMLSGETAAGKYPLESLKMMVEIAEATEQSIDYWGRFQETAYAQNTTVPYAISRSSGSIAMQLSAKAILTVTQSGYTAKLVSLFRPKCPILAVGSSDKVRRKLALVWGVLPSHAAQVESTDELFDLAIDNARRERLVETGDTVVITAGVPVGVSGTTNIIKAQQV